MDYLDIPRPPHLTERSQSQTHFVIEEDGGSDYGDNNGELSTDNRMDRRNWSKGIILALSAICLGLAIALTVMSVLYAKSIPLYEVCHTKECAQTATMFIQSMDDRIDPCIDFHQFACGNWISDTAAAVSVPMYDHTTIMRDRIIGRLRSITENISMTDIPALHQLKYMYDSCVDLESIEKAGLKPIVNFIRSYLPPSSEKNLTIGQLLGKIRRYTGQSYIIDLQVAIDYMNTSYNSIFLDQPDLAVDKDTILGSDDTVKSYEFLMQSVATIFVKTYGDKYPMYQTIVDNVKGIVDMEVTLASGMTPDVDRSKPKLYNLMTVRELNRLFSGQNMFDNSNITEMSTSGIKFNWTEYFEVVFEGMLEINENTTVIVNDLGYMHSLVSFFNTTEPYQLDLYLAWQLLFTMGKDVTSEVRSLFNRFTGKLDGNEATPNRKTACISLLDDQLPFLLTHKYILKYVRHSVIDETDEMSSKIIRAFKEMVYELDWMDQNTKSKAMEKADHVRRFIGYPTWMTSPSAVQNYHNGLRFTNSFFKNMLSLMEWVSLKSLNTVGQKVDLSWPDVTDSPAEADAFYDDELNAITFPAGFLQQPFIGMGIRAADYGSLGAVIGHELTHGFDTEGRYSDEYGRLNSWWSVDTLQRFVERAQCFIDQYNGYRLPELESQLGDNNTVNGRQTLAENIADNGGIREALRAYRSYIADRGGPEARLPGLEKFSPEQVFFLAFAQSWCSYMNPTSLEDLVLTNVHSPAKFRIIGPLSNFDEFSNIWQCDKGAPMNPSNKCVLW